MASSRIPVSVPSEQPPRLLVLIDVEEEFDWSAPFDRASTGVSHLAELPRVLPIFEAFGIVPVAVCSYPVVDDPDGGARLAELAADGRLLIGAHLHPWVCPPHDEEVCREHSFPGNLPRELERAKLAALSERIEEVTGHAPRVYQAGRYGVGPHSAELLEELGYAVDMSVAPPFDYGDEGGPDYTTDGNEPYWFGRRRALLGLPVTGAFVGFLKGSAPRVFRMAQRRGLRWARLPGVLSRLGVVERLRLSPEGHELADLQRLTKALLADGLRTFTFSFHSPSLRPGCTSYVTSTAERDAFLDRCRAYFEWFCGELGGAPASPLGLHEEWLRSAPPDPSRIPPARS